MCDQQCTYKWSRKVYNKMTDIEMKMICALIAESMWDTGKPQKVKRKKLWFWLKNVRIQQWKRKTKLKKSSSTLLFFSAPVQIFIIETFPYQCLLLPHFLSPFYFPQAITKTFFGGETYIFSVSINKDKVFHYNQHVDKCTTEYQLLKK